MTGNSNRTHHLSVSSSDAESYEPKSYFRTKRKAKLIVIITFNLMVISVLLIIRFAHPRTPRFVLQDATVFNFNLESSPPNFLNSSLQLTLSSHNPNQISGIYFTDMGIFAEYRNQQITNFTTIPALYQAHKETNVWSLFVNGLNIPIAPYSVPALMVDQSSGTINIFVKVEGHVRWKIGSLVTRRYHIHVFCNATMDFGSSSVTYNNGAYVFLSAKYLLYRRCTVTV